MPNPSGGEQSGQPRIVGAMPPLRRCSPHARALGAALAARVRAIKEAIRGR